MFAHVGVMAGAYFINTLLGTHAYLDPNHEPALGLIKQALWFACVSNKIMTNCTIYLVGNEHSLTLMCFYSCLIFECK